MLYLLLLHYPLIDLTQDALLHNYLYLPYTHPYLQDILVIAEEKYRDFQAHEVDDSGSIATLKAAIKGRSVLLIAPGPSLNEHQEELLQVAKEHKCIVMSATFIPNFIDCNYVFLSNLKRYNTTFNPQKKVVCLIHTSNIEVVEANAVRVNYTSLLDEENVIMDNSSIMLINLLTKLEPLQVYLAGMDGYKADTSNYAEERLVLFQLSFISSETM